MLCSLFVGGFDQLNGNLLLLLVGVTLTTLVDAVVELVHRAVAGAPFGVRHGNADTVQALGGHSELVAGQVRHDSGAKGVAHDVDGGTDTVARGGSYQLVYI